jgi:hypothetical protein
MLTSIDLILGDILQRRMVEALAESAKHLDEFESFDEALRSHDNDEVDSWAAMLKTFYSDPSAPCPFDVEESGMSKY